MNKKTAVELTSHSGILIKKEKELRGGVTNSPRGFD
jgi:hypothetical protein